MKIRNGMIALVAATAIAFGTGAAGAAQPASSAGASAQQVRQLMEVVGTKRLMTQMVQQMTGMMSKAMPCVPEGTLQSTLASPQALDEIINRMVPVYQQHFTNADIKGLMTFYRSPLGQKMLREMPLIMQQSMQIGQQWGQERGRAMVAQLQKEGKLDAQGQCPATQGRKVVPSSTR